MSNFDIIDKCKELNISNFKGVFMRDELKGSISKNECLILNMDDSKGDGTHWTSLYSKNNKCYYFDSYGFDPPIEVQNYCRGKENYSNSFKIQTPDEVICGHYSLYMLYKLNKDVPFYDILSELYNRNH